MLATVSQTRSLVGTYYYDRALNQKEKGGQVIASKGIPQWASAKTQLAYMQAYCSDKYQVKAINVVLSHSSVDKKLIENNPDLENKCVNDFIHECKGRGIDLDNTPWIIMKHVNTDCIHYHMIILTTMFNGKRLDTGFIGMRASKAAWATSKKNGLHYALGIDKREQDRLNFIQETLGEEKLKAIKSGAELSDDDNKKLKEATSKHRAATYKARKEKRERSKAELTAWKNKIKELVEGTANFFIKKERDMQEFVSLLDKHGMFISKDKKGRYNVTAKYHGRLITYKATRLGIAPDLLDTIKGNKEMDEYLRKMDGLLKKKELEDDIKRREQETTSRQLTEEDDHKSEVKEVKDIKEVKDVEDVKTDVGLSDEELATLEEVSSQNTAAATKVKNTKRAQSIAEANKRKQKIKNIIESNADYCIKKHLYMKDFISLLKDNNIQFNEDENGGYTVTANNGKKDVTYKVARLGVDISLFESIKKQEEEDERQSKLKKERMEQESKEKELKAKETRKESEKDKQPRVQEEQRENKPRWHMGI